MKLLELNAQQTAKINALPGLFPYQNTKENSPLEGKTYRRFSYGGIVFTVNSEDRFCSLFDADTLYSVDFEEGLLDGKATLSLVGAISTAKMISLTKTDAIINAISKPNYNPFATGVTHEELV
jgi:hypothetical protein